MYPSPVCFFHLTYSSIRQILVLVHLFALLYRILKLTPQPSDVLICCWAFTMFPCCCCCYAQLINRKTEAQGGVLNLCTALTHEPRRQIASGLLQLGNL